MWTDLDTPHFVGCPIRGKLKFISTVHVAEEVTGAQHHVQQSNLLIASVLEEHRQVHNAFCNVQA